MYFPSSFRWNLCARCGARLCAALHCYIIYSYTLFYYPADRARAFLLLLLSSFGIGSGFDVCVAVVFGHHTNYDLVRAVYTKTPQPIGIKVKKLH